MSDKEELRRTRFEDITPTEANQRALAIQPWACLQEKAPKQSMLLLMEPQYAEPHVRFGGRVRRNQTSLPQSPPIDAN